MDLNLFVAVLLHKEALHTAAGNQTNANAGSGMEMTAKHQKSLGMTAATARICTCVYDNTVNIFSRFSARRNYARVRGTLSCFSLYYANTWQVNSWFALYGIVIYMHRCCQKRNTHRKCTTGSLKEV